MLNIEKLVDYFTPKHEKEEKIRAAGEYVNTRFPDAIGYIDKKSPSCLAHFKVGELHYWVRFSNCKIHFGPKGNLNPPYWYHPMTKEVYFDIKMRRDHLIYRKNSKKKNPETWQEESKRKKKEKKERVDELLLAARGNEGLSFNPSSPSTVRESDSISTDSVSRREPARQPIKIESLSDIKKINKEKKPPKPRKKVKPKKVKPKSATKGIW